MSAPPPPPRVRSIVNEATDQTCTLHVCRGRCSTIWRRRPNADAGAQQQEAGSVFTPARCESRRAAPCARPPPPPR
eukprot:4732910-Prymnesium_polylepis.1